MAQTGQTPGVHTLVYFHGVPGAPREADLFREALQGTNVRLVCIDRFAIDPALTGTAYYREIAAQILRETQGHPFDVAGFSMGAFIALQTCNYLQGQVRHLHLISAAAPLEAGDFLDGMAGKVVFQLARSRPLMFRILSLWQGVLARFAPDVLYSMLFGSAAAADQQLAPDPVFQAHIQKALRMSFGTGLEGYVRDVRAYVQPWADDLSRILDPTTVWHGAQDNWSPVAMATYLAGALPCAQPARVLPGLSHYSCLIQAMPEICEAAASP
jgi:pimeloyl-ACP methyl ester carboxylesterase